MTANDMNIREDILDITSGIDNHKKLLYLCIADYLVARNIVEITEHTKEIMFVFEMKDKYPDIWQNYLSDYPALYYKENINIETVKEIITKDKKRQADRTEKYLRDYYVLRDKYKITSEEEAIYPEMSRSECPIYACDFIELNKEYAYFKSQGLPCSDKYFSLLIYGETSDITEILNKEILTAKSYITEENKTFIELNNALLTKKIDLICNK